MGLQAIENAHSDYESARLLFQDLCDDAARLALYRELTQRPRVLKFVSRADPEGPAHEPQPVGAVFLLTRLSHIQAALSDASRFSNRPYRALGSGNFMLGLDGPEHKAQRAFGEQMLRYTPQQVAPLAALAFKAAALLPLKQARFDAAELAEQAALRFVALLFGFAQTDLPLLEAAMRAAYKALNYQIIGRHFVTDPSVPEAARRLGGALLIRVVALIDEYAAGGHPPKQVLPLPMLGGVSETVLARLARANDGGSGAMRAVVALGNIAGTIGNVQAAVANCLSRLFDQPAIFDCAKAAALAGKTPPLENYIGEMLRLQPPAAFLPRRALCDMVLDGTDVEIPKGANVVLAMGAAALDPSCAGRTAADGADALLFGAVPGSIHDCIGRHLGWPLVVQTVCGLLCLPGLAQCIDETSGRPQPLKRLWGVKAESYPLQYQCAKRMVQQPLKVIMRVKQPLAEHAEALRKIVRYGAPLIERSLDDAEHVHFAWFVFLEGDSKLALFTVFDGSFDAYIEHFAVKMGPLFEQLFEHIEDAPPEPVAEYPKEFVETIRRYDASAVGGYFYSAYPLADVARIRHAFPAGAA